jgi:hypothetical protein
LFSQETTNTIVGGVVLAAFWLTSSHLSAIPSVVAVVAIVGGALITLGGGEAPPAMGSNHRLSSAPVVPGSDEGYSPP